MRSCAIILGFVTVAALAVAAASPATAEPPAFKVIVNPDNPAQGIHRDVLRNAFLGKGAAWPRNLVVRPIGLSPKFITREQFAKNVLKKTLAQLKSYWTQQIFSGKGVPPPEAGSTSDVIEFVLANPGAVGYLPADADPGKAKVIAVE